MPSSGAMRGMPGMSGMPGSGTTGSHAANHAMPAMHHGAMPAMHHGMAGAGAMHMYMPAPNAHNWLVAWPISVPGVLALALAAWAGWRALVLWRRGAPRPGAWWLASGAMVVAGAAGIGWVATSSHASPFAYAVLVVEVVAGVYYLAGVRRLAAKRRGWPISRTVMFMAGLASLGLALHSPATVFVSSSFSYHVVQHLLLMVVAPPLLALSAPMTLAMQTTSHHTKVILLKILNSRAFAVLTFPVVVWFLYYGVMVTFFLTPLIRVAMDHMALMDALNVLFFLGGCLFWWPTVGIDTSPRWKMSHGMKIINLLIGVPFESFLGIALMGVTVPVASMYTLSGTHAGGGLLWGLGELSAFVGTAIVMLEWSRDDDRVAAREDRRTAARQAAAARAAAATTGPGGVPAGPPVPEPPPVSITTPYYEEAYRSRGIPVPTILGDHRPD